MAFDPSRPVGRKSPPLVVIPGGGEPRAGAGSKTAKCPDAISLEGRPDEKLERVVRGESRAGAALLEADARARTIQYVERSLPLPARQALFRILGEDPSLNGNPFVSGEIRDLANALLNDPKPKV